MASASVIVTGATGFLGGAVARRLHAGGTPVLALGRDAAKGAALAAAGIAFRRVDLSDGPAVAEALAAPMAGGARVVHCAALSAPWGRAIDFWRANVRGTWHVADACRRAGTRLVHVSSPSVSFRFRDQMGLRESDRLPAAWSAPNAYIATKRQAEDVVRDLARQGLDVVTLRPRAIFGPGDVALFPRLLRAQAAGRLRVIGDGHAMADLTYVDTVVDAIEAALHAPARCRGRIYHITNGEPVRLWDHLGEIFRALGTPLDGRRVPRGLALAAATAAELAARLTPGQPEPTITRYGVGVLGWSQTLDVSAARRELGWAPRVSLDEGTARFLAWWRVQDAGHRP